ncbi:MAG: acyl-CoA dehydrogenase family protein [Sphingomonadaceae bacterium]
MEFIPDPKLREFRQEVRSFLEERLTPDLVQHKMAMYSPQDAMRQWQAILHSKGWGAPSWGQQHGGTGWSVEQQLVFEDECVKAGTPSQEGFGQKLLGPVLNHFATDELRQAHTPHILSGERHWCQGFSEPGSGSDLASLRTRAEADGEGYVINGQKIWTSYAHQADWIFLLARTDPEVKKQAGISFFLIDMATPGITVRPIRSIDGRHHLNEVFLDNVAVPAANRVGEEGMGWTITRFLLNNEHATTAELPRLRDYLRSMKQLAVTGYAGQQRLADRSDYLARIGAFETELQAVAVMVERVAAMHGDAGHYAHALGSMLKLRATDLQQRMSVFLVEMLGDDGALASPADDRGIASEMFFRRASTIYGGTSEVQRGIVARLMYGF